MLLQTHDFIQITFQVPQNDQRIWNVALTPPGSMDEYVIPLEDCKLDSSGLLEIGASPESKELAKYGIRLLGFHRRFYKTVQMNPDDSTANANDFTTRMIIISAPTHGEWKARIFVRDNGEGTLLQDQKIQLFTVTLSNNKSIQPLEQNESNLNLYSWQY